MVEVRVSVVNRDSDACLRDLAALVLRFKQFRYGDHIEAITQQLQLLAEPRQIHAMICGRRAKHAWYMKIRGIRHVALNTMKMGFLRKSGAKLSLGKTYRD